MFQVRKHANISMSPTLPLQRWHEKGSIQAQVLPSGHRRYKLPDQVTLPETPQVRSQHSKIIYCRVSSPKQKSDLERQSSLLSHQFPEHHLITDIGSGLNWKRPGLLSILGQSMSGGVSEVVVASKDRLCRFAFDLVAWILQTHGTQIVVLDQTDKSPIDEIGEDVLAIMQVFACRWNGQRRYRKTQKSKANPKDPGVPDTSAEAQACEDGRND